MKYRPDVWQLVKVTVTETNEVMFKIFACWYGGYMGSDAWKFSSTIERVAETDTHYEFHNSSGSTYFCHKNCTGMSGYGSNVFLGLTKNPEVATLEIVDIEVLKASNVRWSVS